MLSSYSLDLVLDQRISSKCMEGLAGVFVAFGAVRAFAAFEAPSWGAIDGG